MCGIFGIISAGNNDLGEKETKKLLDSLFNFSETRGKESAGICIQNFDSKKIEVLKDDIPAGEFIRSEKYNSYYKNALGSNQSRRFSIIAHSRLVTNGTEKNNNNNQPVVKNGGVLVHNGIVTNVDEMWKKNPQLTRTALVDSEFLGDYLREKLKSNNIDDSLNTVFTDIEGAASIATVNENSDDLFLATNNGSIYYTINDKKDLLVFASEDYILKTVIKENQLGNFGLNESVWLGSFGAMTMNLSDPSEHEVFELFKSSQRHSRPLKVTETNYKIINHSEDKAIDPSTWNVTYNPNAFGKLRGMLQYNDGAIRNIKRCSKCLLPETFPFLAFDEKGVCNICNNYKPTMQEPKLDDLERLLSKFRRPGKEPDCVAPFSGGRDSSYGLHYMVKELGLKPKTYTYDWGMVTDLARRNIYRVCGELGIENILVSANLKVKRRNIRLNVEAWLKRPHLGMIPLFMAGDKHFIYYVNKIKRENGITLNIWCPNRLENTDFKVGFCGISPDFDKDRIDNLAMSKKVGLAAFYAKQFLINPGYINKSLIDSATSFYSYYVEPRGDYVTLFDYVPWDEQHIEKTLFEKYNWEISPDTTSTWRIGDGTAAFYNYIYYTVAGFSEFDTFRSNQIREGMITREEGLEAIYRENRPRFDSLKWYFDTVGIDFEKAIEIVNKIPKLYKI